MNDTRKIPFCPKHPLNVHVVILNNYLRPHHVKSYQALARRVRKLTILLSVAMEPDRDWNTNWDELDVCLQKNWTFTANWKHSTGFNEINFIHLPIDTTTQLKRLEPDIVFSYEMGMRTLLASWFCLSHRRIPLVMVGNMSEQIEQERGFFRRRLRGVIGRSVNAFTYNGPSCLRYLEHLSIPKKKLFHLPYCFDNAIVPEGIHHFSVDGIVRLLYCGAISERKGILQFTKCLQQWCYSHQDRRIEFAIAGDGPLVNKVIGVTADNLSLKLLGNLDVAEMKAAYQHTDICVFPSLADEWGLVPIEAMASGIPILGSSLAQSVETYVNDDINGWIFDPTSIEDTLYSINRMLSCSTERLLVMGQLAKKSVASISPSATAECFCKIVQQLVID